MRAIAFSMEFRGQSTPFTPGVLSARGTAPSGAFVTRIDHEGVHGTFEPREGAEALLERRLTFLNETTFEDAGTISFGDGNAVRFHSVGLGQLGPSPEPSVRQGTVAWVVDGGAGVLEHAAGRIVSNFLVSDLGELTDRQLGVLFVEP
ncbi:MAG TPA: hypothetical protein VFB25_11795 [Gaiellaceae bacterium]|nr:hypothetical protein [Gaiellaceae bacterium]